MSNPYLNFAEISTVPFKDVLDWLNIPYQQDNRELKGDNFVVSVEKNLYKQIKGEGKGSVINFVSSLKDEDLRSAALEIKIQFQSQAKEEPKEIPNLLLEHHKMLEPYGITEEVSKEYEVGIVRQRSIFAGKLAFKVYDGEKHTGYVAYDIKEGRWLFPKGFKRTLYNIQSIKDIYVIVVPSTFDVFHLLKLGNPNAVALIGKSMTDDQEKQLEKFKHILLLHPEPENIVNRLSKKHFIHAPIVDKVSDLTDLKDFI